MTRPRKQTVDYFPHYVRHGQTMEILEQEHGLSGYAFWFKLLERIGDSDGHFLDCKNPVTWKYLQTKTRQDEKTTEEILNLLAGLEAIDPELWKGDRVIWCQHFVDGIAVLYRNRIEDTPIKPGLSCKKPHSAGVSDVRNPHRRGEERIGDKNLVCPKANDAGNSVDFEEWWKAYPSRRKTGKPLAKAKWDQLKKSGRLLPLDKMIAVLESQKSSQDWTKAGGDYIPAPVPYLNQFKFLDESSQKETKGSMDDYMADLEKKVIKDGAKPAF